jgi:hypothetical protein
MKKNINWVIIKLWNIYPKFTHTFKNSTNKSLIDLRKKIFNMFKKKSGLIEYEDQLNYDHINIFYLALSGFFHNVSILKKN